MKTLARPARKIIKPSSRTGWSASRRAKRDYRLYAFLLADSKYYIGLTAYKNVALRFQEHRAGTSKRGAKWTSRYKPLSIIEIRGIGTVSLALAERLETIMTLEYIRKYGINNVRGGELCAVNGRVASARYAKVRTFKKYTR